METVCDTEEVETPAKEAEKGSPGSNSKATPIVKIFGKKEV